MVRKPFVRMMVIVIVAIALLTTRVSASPFVGAAVDERFYALKLRQVELGHAGLPAIAPVQA